jgi:glyoxylase I family protein
MNREDMSGASTGWNERANECVKSFYSPGPGPRAVRCAPDAGQVDPEQVIADALERRETRKREHLSEEESRVERVNGIGGVFFKAKDPSALAEWYETHLGVQKTPQTYEEGSWWQEEGPTVFAPFDSDTGYFGESDKQWMINFRVDDLEAMTAQLRRAGIVVEVQVEVFPNGSFAHLSDPEGNRIELWEPDGTDLRRPERD